MLYYDWRVMFIFLRSITSGNIQTVLSNVPDVLMRYPRDLTATLFVPRAQVCHHKTDNPRCNVCFRHILTVSLYNFFAQMSPRAPVFDCSSLSIIVLVTVTTSKRRLSHAKLQPRVLN